MSLPMVLAAMSLAIPPMLAAATGALSRLEAMQSLARTLTKQALRVRKRQ
jgi:hypothetical protein